MHVRILKILQKKKSEFYANKILEKIGLIYLKKTAYFYFPNKMGNIILSKEKDTWTYLKLQPPY